MGVRVTQAAVEVLTTGSPAVRATQVAVEVLRTVEEVAPAVFYHAGGVLAPVAGVPIHYAA